MGTVVYFPDVAPVPAFARQYGPPAKVVRHPMAAIATPSVRVTREVEWRLYMAALTLAAEACERGDRRTMVAHLEAALRHAATPNGSTPAEAVRDAQRRVAIKRTLRQAGAR